MGYSTSIVRVVQVPVVGIQVQIPVQVEPINATNFIAELSSFHQSFSQVAFVFYGLK